MSTEIETYSFAPEFEAQVIAYLVEDRLFYNAVQQGIQSAAFPSKEAQLVAEACGQVFKETGQGPGDMTIVLQKLRYLLHELGKITLDACLEATDYVQDCCDLKRSPRDAVLQQFSQQIQTRMQTDALRDALMGMDSYELRRKLEKAENIGKIDASIGEQLGVASLENINRLRLTEKLPTGIPPLDDKFGGGIGRSQFLVFFGNSNVGKSTALGQMAGAVIREGGLVLYGTNELPPEMVIAKTFADLTDVPFQKILEGHHDVCSRRYAERFQKNHWGSIFVKDINGMSPAEQDNWITEVEETTRRKVDLYINDYADRTPDGKPGDRSDYLVMKNVYNDLFTIAQKRKIVVATASQAKAKKGSGYLELNDMSDSRHKGRIATVVVSLNRAENNPEELWAYICKQKMGASEVAVGPITHDFAYGRWSQLPDAIRKGASPSTVYEAQKTEQDHFNAVSRMTTDLR